MYCRDEMPYSADAFFELLALATNQASKYDGLRVYFAKYPDSPANPAAYLETGCAFVPGNANGHEYGQMTIIFVPTNRGSRDPTTHRIRHVDDIKHCWVLVNNAVQIISSQIASLWIQNALGSYLATFEQDGKTYTRDSTYLETHALWYSRALLAHSLLFNKGIIDYLYCRQSHDNIDSVKVEFAAYRPEDRPKPYVYKYKYNYKLTLIFYFPYPDKSFGKGPGFSLFYSDLTKKVQNLLSGTGGTTDTGQPCPPPDCSSDGAKLPQ